MRNLEDQNVKYEELIYRFLFHEATADEICLLRKWIKSDVQNQMDFDGYRNIQQLIQRAFKNNEYDEQTAWNKLNEYIMTSKEALPSKHFYLQQLGKIAAIFIVAFFSGILTLYFIYHSPSKINNNIAYSEHKVSYGSKSQLILPDGSKVWLNAGSKLRYSFQFNQLIREVYLEGEAFFDVSKNKNKPFFVKTMGVTIKVLGTVFNVKAYPNDKVIETSVQRGIVQVISNSTLSKGVQKVFLHANQKATYIKMIGEILGSQVSNKSIGKVIKKDSLENIMPFSISDSVNMKAITSWKEKKWIIEKEHLGDLGIDIERRYDVKVLFADKTLKSYVFSGVLIDESLEQVLNVIKLSAPVNYEVNKKVVTFYLNKKFATKKSK